MFFIDLKNFIGTEMNDLIQSALEAKTNIDLSTLPVLLGGSRFCLLSPGFPVFNDFLPVSPCLSVEVSLQQKLLKLLSS